MTAMQNQPCVAVIGYGVAGVNAAIALRNEGYKGLIRAFSNTNILPYSPVLISYYAGAEKTYEQCFPWTAEELNDLGVEVIQDCSVTDLDVSAHVIHTSKGEFGYSKCIIASGSTPVLRGFPECDYEPITLRTMEDAQRLKNVLEDPATKRILVSGASMVALKTLEACIDHGKETAMVGRSSHVLGARARSEAAVRFERGLKSYGVDLKFGRTIKAVDFAAGASEAKGCKLKVIFSDDSVDYFDEIALAHGMRGCLDFVREGSLEVDQGLLVDEFMRTSNPDLYAAGDVAQALELSSGEKRVVALWKNAAVQGACAGAAIAAEMAGTQPDQSKAYKGSVAANTIAVKDTLFISAGSMDAEGRRVEVKGSKDMTVVYIYEDTQGDGSRLVGFNLVCDNNVPGSVAYDTGAMLTLRIQAGCNK